MRSEKFRYPPVMQPHNAMLTSPVAPGLETRTLSARVDLGRLSANADRLRRSAQGLGLLAVVKADAYGHGAVQVARTLETAGVDGFCVATLSEALVLRQAGVRLPIQVFTSTRPEELALASSHAIDLTVVSSPHLRELAQLVPEHPVGLHLEVDTGMGRSGVPLAELGACLSQLRALQPRLRGIMSHFASAEESESTFTLHQHREFAKGIAALKDGGISAPMIHQANSAGCLRGFTEGHTHARCGIALYGLADLDEARAIGLEPILELVAEVTRVQSVDAGTTVGYGCTYVVPHRLTLVTLNCGYADGYPRALANRAWAEYRGICYPVVGRVSMDSITVAIPEQVPIEPRDTMILLSRDPKAPHSVFQTAKLLGTIPYEVTCALNQRVVRVSA